MPIRAFQFLALIILITSFESSGTDSIPGNAISQTVTMPVDPAKSDTAKVLLLYPNKNKNWGDHLLLNMPWITVLVVSLIGAFVNYRLLQISQRNNRNALSQQIQSSEKIALANIENSKILAKLQFDAVINSKNRQEWIDNCRELLSELVTSCTQQIIESETSVNTKETVIERMQQINRTRYQIALLLDPAEGEQKRVLDSVRKLVATVTSPSFETITAFTELEELIKSSRDMLYFHWHMLTDLKSKI